MEIKLSSVLILLLMVNIGVMTYNISIMKDIRDYARQVKETVDAGKERAASLAKTFGGGRFEALAQRWVDSRADPDQQ